MQQDMEASGYRKQYYRQVYEMAGQNPGNIFAFVKHLWKRITVHKREEETADVPVEEEEGNPYIFQLREIMEFILKEKKIPYKEFSPIIIDGSDSETTLMAAELLSRDLNRLILLTDRPVYFESYTDNMYEEQGLIVEIFPKDRRRIAEIIADATMGNVILDFEESKERTTVINFGKKLYIPVFKKRWERTGNLDIAVPIGYNTMIVRGIKETKQQPFHDRFERAFYDNK